MNILKYDDIDISKINYSKPEKVGPSYFGSISYGDNLKPLYIQTPKLTCINSILELKEKKNEWRGKNNWDWDKVKLRKKISEIYTNSIKEKSLFRNQRKAVNAGANGTLEYTIKEGVNKAKIADSMLIKNKK